MGGQTATHTSKDKNSRRSEERSQASARHSAGSGPHADVLDLQHAAGNWAVSEWVQSSQTPSLGNDVPPIVRSVLNSSGQPLDPATRAFMEPRFGHDFSRVRVHTDARAVESAREVHALAYTVGPNVVFGADEYAPTTHRGRGLLAHELAHTIQQRSATGAPPSADPHRIFESSADAAGRDVANGRRVSGDLPACGVGLSRAPVPLEELPDEEIQEKLNQVTEKLKQPAYEGREGDLNWQRRLIAALQRKAKAREPVAPAAPPPPPAPPAPSAPPAPDPQAERDAAVKEAEAFLARMEKEEKEGDDEDEEIAPVRKGAPRRRKTVPGPPTTLSLLTPDEACGGQCFTDEQIYKEYNEAKKRIDEQISKEREISKIPYKTRLNRVRSRLVAKSDYWYSRNTALSRMTGEEVWHEGVSSDLFLESEKRWVYEDQNSKQELIREEQEEAAKQSRRNFEIAQYNKHVARGKQLSSPAPFLQPFAFAALGPLVGAAYAGTQTGAIVGEAYNACAHGKAAECAAAIAKGGAAVVVHRVTRGKPQTPPPFPSPGRTAKPDFVITRTPKLDPQTGKIKTSVIETASGRHFDAEVDPTTGIGQIVDRASRQVVGIIRNGEVSPPTANILPPAKSTPTSDIVPVPPAGTGSTVVKPAPPVVPPAVTGGTYAPMRRPPGGGPRAGMTATERTLTPHKKSAPVVEVLPRGTVPMKDFEPPEPGHYIRRKPPDAETQRKILARAGRTSDGRLRDANTGRALEEGEAVWGHAPYYQFKEMRDMAEKLGWKQEQFDEFFRDPAKWQVEYGPTNSGRVFDRIPRQRPVH